MLLPRLSVWIRRDNTKSIRLPLTKNILHKLSNPSCMYELNSVAIYLALLRTGNITLSSQIMIRVRNSIESYKVVR